MRLLTLIFVALLGSKAMAAQTTPPNCWSESGADVVDGSFTVALSTDVMIVDELLAVMEKANGQNIRAESYPLVFAKKMYLYVQAVDNGIGAHKLSREDLKAVVSAELEELLKFPGVSIYCNVQAHPPGAVTVRN